MDLNATSSLVTGGASGIGLASARRLAALGARVVVVDMNEEKGEAAAKELEEQPSPVVGCFSGAELGAVFGREHLVHVGVRKGRLAKALRKELTKLAGFRGLIPDEWTDKEHETPFIPYGIEGGK